MSWEAVIGLEVHAQLRTRTKIFCGCSTAFGAPPNHHTCPVCLGHPGALPVLNGRAVELAVTAGLALGCTINERSIFARKNYFYPDLPKGYQISQYDEPLASGGRVAIEIDGHPHHVRLTRIHMEEDAGKSVHDGLPGSEKASFVDLNRAGVPLIEIVSEPDLRSAEEAYLYLQRLRSLLRYTGVCDGNMEQGSFRCDANVSIRPAGDPELHTRTELKNLNSMRNVQRALEFEIGRQIALVEAGGEVEQVTVLWDEGNAETRPMRGKEEAHDYRYFPEPDLPPLLLDPIWVDALRTALPELPAERKQRLRDEYGLEEREAQLLTLERPLADFFEQTARKSKNARASANFVLNDLMRQQNEAGRAEEDIPVDPAALAELIGLVDAGAISVSAARWVFEELYRSGRPPTEIVKQRGLEQVSDEDSLRRTIEQVLEANPTQLEQYRSGKHGLLGYFVGEVMKATRGKANPRKVNELLREMIGA